MSVSKAKMAANKKHDQTHFKYQSVKLKISEYKKLKEAVERSEEPLNTFLRSAILTKVKEYIPPADPAPESSEEAKEG